MDQGPEKEIQANLQDGCGAEMLKQNVVCPKSTLIDACIDLEMITNAFIDFLKTSTGAHQ